MLIAAIYTTQEFLKLASVPTFWTQCIRKETDISPVGTEATAVFGVGYRLKHLEAPQSQWHQSMSTVFVLITLSATPGRESSALQV